jgi:hypothetical protein
MRPKRCSSRLGFHGQVVIHHEVRTLKIDTLASSIGGEQHLHLGIVLERLLRLHPIFPAHPTMNHHYRFVATQQRGDAALQIIERVAMFSENYELLVR